MIMQNPELDPQDQRKTSSMEDSTAMTIEFLRARLLSERSVSRSARQRADELANRVKELEEQIKVVTLQRKMAEKATVEVLAILESQGISDGSGDFDLGSDQEMPCESGVGNDSVKEDQRSMSSRGRRYGSDELSGSDLDSSLVPGRSLSWKGRVDSPRSLEKYKTYNVRRRSSVSSVSSSPKHHRLGKSCRQIRRREARSVVEESMDKPLKIDSLENEVVYSSEEFPNCLDRGSNFQRIESKIQDEDESEVKVANNNHDNGYGRETDMEKALEHQAKLIGQYEAMEKAQREWEEKFRENNNSTPDSCDPGNHSDITEERDDSKVQTPCSDRVVTSNSQEASEAQDVLLPEEMSKAEPIDNILNTQDNTGGLHNQKSTTVTTSGLLSQKNSYPVLDGKQNYESSENGNYQPSGRLHQGPHTHGSPQHNKPTSSPQNDAFDGLPQRDASSSKNDHSALVPHGQPELSGVLESLKQAKMSLQQEISRLPLVEGGYSGKAIKPSGSLSKREDRYEIPIGTSGLFRLPTDFSDELTARSNFLDPPSGFGRNFYLDKGISRSSDYQFGTTYSGTRSRFSPQEQSLARQYLESGSRFDTKKPTSDPLLDGGLPSSSIYMYPRYPIYPSYQDLTPQMPTSDGLSRPYPNSTGGVRVPPADNFSFYDDQARPRPNIYR
ncbi:hypothetical protein L6164_006842 [Bauhinia variegata]|uniref:Uncharacterized protein n=1 Tax=Bauhinia variegata TaxID=167791 RepID=A0ACB9PYG6_BAUVA|nr:hypothetical protein L6164_006842 [Bauhinia variegata]